MFGDEREGLAVVGVADAVESVSVVPCDSGSVRVGLAHSRELVDGGHASFFGGDDDAHFSGFLSRGETHRGCGSGCLVGASRAFAHDVGGFELVEVVALEMAPHVARPFEGWYESVGGGLVPSGEGAQLDGVLVTSVDGGVLAVVVAVD